MKLLRAEVVLGARLVSLNYKLRLNRQEPLIEKRISHHDLAMNLPRYLLLETLFCFRLIFLNLVLEDLILKLVNFKEVQNSVIEHHFMFPSHLTFVARAEATNK